MGEKQNDLFTIGIIALMLLAFSVTDVLAHAGLLHGDFETGATAPVYTSKSLMNGTYFEEVEAYVTADFYNVTRWSRLVQKAELLMGKRDWNDVLLGKRDTFFEKHLTREYEGAKVQESLAYLKNLTENHHARVMLIPTADEIWSDRLPLYADAFDQKAYLDQVREIVGEEHYLDLYAVLAEHANEAIYYRTDPHWTSLAAYYAYYAWWKASGKLLPYYYDMRNATVVTESFVGPLAKAAGLEAKGEEILVFEETEGKSVSVIYDDYYVADGYYRPEHLDSDNALGYFLGERFGAATIQTGKKSKPELVVFGDENSHLLIPLLAPHYSKIFIVHLDQFQGNPKALLERRRDAEVLVVQSVPNWLDLFEQKE